MNPLTKSATCILTGLGVLVVITAIMETGRADFTHTHTRGNPLLFFASDIFPKTFISFKYIIFLSVSCLFFFPPIGLT